MTCQKADSAVESLGDIGSDARDASPAQRSKVSEAIRRDEDRIDRAYEDTP